MRNKCEKQFLMYSMLKNVFIFGKILMESLRGEIQFAVCLVYLAPTELSR